MLARDGRRRPPGQPSFETGSALATADPGEAIRPRSQDMPRLAVGASVTLVNFLLATPGTSAGVARVGQRARLLGRLSRRWRRLEHDAQLTAATLTFMNAGSSSPWLSREFIWEPQAVQAMVWLTLFT